MNWIRDNILKIVLFIFAIIIVVVVIVACSMSGGKPVDNTSGYIELENKLQNAAISYVKEHPSILPKTTDIVKKVKLDTLIEAGKMNKMYSPENRSVACKGYVQIEKVSEDTKSYRYTPYISCGNYYITKSIANYILDKETKNGDYNRTAGDGLYSLNEEYIYRGEFPENFIMLGNRLYRIMKIDSNNRLQLVSTERTYDYYVWDDRYNVQKDYNSGINDFEKSRLNESLTFILDNTIEEEGEIFFSGLEKSYIEEADFCIGKRDVNDTNIYSGVECAYTVPLKVGLIDLSEYARTSLDPNCKGIFDKSCANYNYFTKIDTKRETTIVTLTAVANDTFSYYRISNGEITERLAYNISALYPVIYINDRVIYKSGSGTYLDPYIVR